MSSALVSATPLHRRIDALTGLRGIAAWWVVLFHFKAYLHQSLPTFLLIIINHGNLAVDMFFCLSGFVIYYNYSTALHNHSISVFDFYRSRLARIYPLHLLMLFLYLGLALLIVSNHRDLAAERFSASGFLLNLLLIQDWATASHPTWNVPAWSVSAEFAAYLAFPLLAGIIAWLPGAARLGLSAAMLLLLNVAYSRVGYNLGSDIETLGVLRCMTQFTIGAALASTYLERPDDCITSRSYLLVLGGALIAAGFWGATSLFIPAAWACLIMVLATGSGNAGVLGSRWMVFAGEISYATYMVHYLCYDIFKLAVVRADRATPVALVLITFVIVWLASVALHRGVEIPCQRILQRQLQKAKPNAS